ncbi:MAG: ribosome biogenesis GTP-binding protein YihA/YsxC [Rickettsiales bacterium]|nr:ribosome biogenesis GTP-binding protein YihA/YsxC [Rickettsiales bacterium]
MKLKEFFEVKPEFVGSFPLASDVPASALPEIAFVGRSNVGKSSLVNAVFKAPLARASNTPGRTQALNFFVVSDALMIVDLPGYGFAKAPLAEVAKWNEQLRKYLSGRAQLRRVFLLIDSRQGLKPADEDMMKTLDKSAVAYQVVLTKTDKVGEVELASAHEGVAKTFKSHPAMHGEILATSAETGTGLDLLRGEIFDLTK